MRNLKNTHGTPMRVVRISSIISLGLIAAACSTSVDRFAGVTGSTNATDTVKTAPASTQNTGAGWQPVKGTTPSFSNRVETKPLADPRGDTSFSSQAKVSSSVLKSDGTVTVNRGDTLYSISRAHNIGVKELIAINNLPEPYHLSEGQVLNVRKATRTASLNPSSDFGSARSSSGTVHKVSSGETLYSLGRQYNVHPREIAQHNNISFSDGLSIGQSVSIPSGSAGFAASTPQQTKQTDTSSASNPSANELLKKKPAQKPETQKVAKLSPAPETKEVKKAAPTPPPASKSLAAGQFRWPVKGRIVSSFGKKSSGARNDGINIAVPAGTKVHAAESGIVAYSGNGLKGYGNLVLIRHADGWVTAYAHNKSLDVKVGQKVKRGDIIARAGSTGSVSSPQVHFEIRKGSTAVNPIKHLGGSYVASKS